jgi:hypothetical protein
MALKKEATSLRSDRTQLNNCFRAAEEQAKTLEEQNKELTKSLKIQTENAKMVMDILAGCGFAENRDSKENYQLIGSFEQYCDEGKSGRCLGGF